MTVTLKIENDEQLRGYIKECIKGQVLSIVREEFIAMIQTELERKIKATDQNRFERIQREAMTEAIGNILNKQHDVSRWKTEFIKPFIDTKINEAVANTNWKLLVDNLAKEKVKALIT